MGIKRTVLLLIAVLALLAGACGFADSLTVGTDTLSAGQQVTSSCQADAMTITYPIGTLTYDSTATLSGFTVTSVSVNGMLAGGAGKIATLELTKGGNGTALAVGCWARSGSRPAGPRH